jgi:LysR family nitrogen assimilation transcriptional regulator
MDLRQLRYFVAVVEAGSFSRAAERVHVAQSALSLHVRSLEESLGAPLLLREPRGVRTTAAGEKLLAHARAILGLVRDAERDVRSAFAEPSGPVSIGIPSGVGRLFNAPLLDACRRELPQVSLRIVEVLPGHVAEWLQGGLIQLGVFYALDQTPEGRPLAEEHFHLVCGAREPSLGGDVALADLPRYPLVLPVCSHNPQQCVAVRARAVGIELEIEARVDSLATILELVCTRPARTILTPGAFLPEWQAGKVFAYAIAPTMKRSVMLAAGPAAAGDPAVRAVEAVARRTADGLVGEGAWPRRLLTSLFDAA